MAKSRRPSPVASELNQFAQWYATHGRRVVDLLKARLADGSSAPEAVSAVMAETGFDAALVEQARQSIGAGYAKAVGYKVEGSISRSAPAETYLRTAETFSGGRPLTTTIRRAQASAIVEREISVALKNRARIGTAVQHLGDSGAIKGDLSKPAKRLIDAVRQSTAQGGDATILRDAQRDINAVLRQSAKLDRTAVGGYQRALQDIVSAAENGADRAFESAVDRAVMFKARYNAERIVRTETMRAYGTGRTNEILSDPLAVSVQWELSSAHDVYDICDVYAHSDQFGLGAGVYPKDHFPPFPAHPNCRCNLSPIYATERPESKYNPDAAAEYVDGLPEWKQKKILGVAAVESGEEITARDIRGFNLPEKKTISG